MSALCISCNSVVDGRRHAVSCDICDRWQHRLCGTGISQADYFKARRGEIELSFVCRPCEQHIPARDEGIEVADEATEAFLEEAMDEEEDFEQTVVMSQTFVIETSLQNESYDSIPAAESTSNIAESMPSMNSASGRDSIDSSGSAVGRDSMDSSVSAMDRDSVDSSVSASGLDSMDSSVSASGRDSMDSSVSNVGRDSVDSSVCASGRDSMDSSVSAVGRDTMDSSVSAVGRDSMDSSVSAVGRDSTCIIIIAY